MLAQKLSSVVKLSSNKISLVQKLQPISTTASLKFFKRSKDKPKLDNVAVKNEESLYGMKLYKDKSLVTDDYVDEQNVRTPFIMTDVDAFKPFQADIQFTGPGLRKWVRDKAMNMKIKSQSINVERVKSLGYDISAAYFIIYNGGKLRFKHIDKLFGPDDSKSEEALPRAFDPNYIVTEIDMSDVDLIYEGLDNFQNLLRVKKAVFQRSPWFDEWCADRLSRVLPNLEYLDLTDCPKFNERGVEAFYKLNSLKSLIVTNHHKSAAFELTCFMLEDIIPGLTVTVLPPKEERECVKNK